MKLKRSARGAFYSCSHYPTCRGTVDAPGEEGEGAARAPARPPPLGVPPGARGLPPGTVPPSPIQLDEHQQRVVDWREGWAVCAAAAGSGKSTVCVERAASLIAEGTIPEAICVLAYNTSAAELVRQRVSMRVGPSGRRIQAYTFHAWCYALLRNWFPTDPRFQHGHLLGGKDGPHPLKVVIPILEELKLELEWGDALKCVERVSELLAPIDEVAVCRAMGWELDADGMPSPANVARAIPYVRFCLAFAQRKQEKSLIDFTDMLCNVARTIAWQPEAAHVRGLMAMYEHVMVDEGQDGNLPRMLIARWLGQGAKSLLVVGDLRQAIARFAGARPELFTDIATTPGVTLLTLPVNRRSSQRIVEAANEIASGRDWNLGGDCVARPDAPLGEPVQVWETPDPSTEARDVITDIQRRVAGGLPLEVGGLASYAVLARTNAMLVDLECAFVARSVPVRVSGSAGGLWSSSVGSELLAYLEGSEGVPTFGLLAVANKPKRFCKKVDVGAVVEAAVAREKAGEGANLLAYLRGARSPGVARLGNDLSRLAATPWPARCLQAARWLGLDEQDEDEGEGGEDRRAALEALMRLAQQLGGLSAIYEYKKEAARGEHEPAVRLSTIHSMKGQEAPVVYTCGVCVGKLPHKRSVTEEDVEEERRLFYVAVTRARDAAIVSTGGTASRFLTELGWVRDELLGRTARGSGA